jgi:NADPH-dependent 2,4-dienoyl-CoA reductase/sulfur reductase-like enzyme
VVVVGGGFGGLHTVKALRAAPVEVTLIDRNNYHLFQPLTYQVATGALSPDEIGHEEWRPLTLEVKTLEHPLDARASWIIRAESAGDGGATSRALVGRCR